MLQNHSFLTESHVEETGKNHWCIENDLLHNVIPFSILGYIMIDASKSNWDALVYGFLFNFLQILLVFLIFQPIFFIAPIDHLMIDFCSSSLNHHCFISIWDSQYELYEVQDNCGQVMQVSHHFPGNKSTSWASVVLRRMDRGSKEKIDCAWWRRRWQ